MIELPLLVVGSFLVFLLVLFLFSISLANHGGLHLLRPKAHLHRVSREV
jgi:hypothetical protein